MAKRTEATALSARDVARFKKGAKTYTEKVTASQKTARAALVAIGTHTRDGKLSDRYK